MASDVPFSVWNKTFTGPRLCAAIADRLTGPLIQTGSDSCRLKGTQYEGRSTRGS
ncbi:hypothetical protein ACTPOK_10625 [Streptomyces inhibens]|uniref:hypothetical protein n=1 Tax=Streptomyces inhibens TaxID=2293571 RepID=UPI00402AD34D